MEDEYDSIKDDCNDFLNKKHEDLKRAMSKTSMKGISEILKRDSLMDIENLLLGVLKARRQYYSHTDENVVDSAWPPE